ncbi:hypothetical protein C8J56DRAFT_879540 [Mycena floridula]|nr:hypothetical protein C8J56DRAFT_879540 [Mycena floridula]
MSTAITKDGHNANSSSISKCICLIDKLILLLKMYPDDPKRTALKKKWEKILQGMYSLMVENKMEWDSVVKDSNTFKRLASEIVISQLHQELYDIINALDPNIDNTMPKFGNIPDGKLPFFNEFVDPMKDLISAHSDAWAEFMANADGGRKPLQPYWHQFVGVLAVVNKAFKSQPVLLMDEVSLR